MALSLLLTERSVERHRVELACPPWFLVGFGLVGPRLSSRFNFIRQPVVVSKGIGTRERVVMVECRVFAFSFRLVLVGEVVDRGHDNEVTHHKSP